MNPTINPFAPGAGTQPPELAGRDEIISNATVALGRAKLGRPVRSQILLGLRDSSPRQSSCCAPSGSPTPTPSSLAASYHPCWSRSPTPGSSHTSAPRNSGASTPRERSSTRASSPMIGTGPPSNCVLPQLARWRSAPRTAHGARRLREPQRRRAPVFAGGFGFPGKRLPGPYSTPGPR